MTNEEVLRVFLKHHKKLTSFKSQKTVSRGNEGKSDIRFAIDWNFIWCNTNEGHNYWSDINEKWHKLCKDLKLEGSINLNKFK